LSEEKVCFIISHIGCWGTDTRKDADQKLVHLFEPVLKEFGYKSIRSDQEDDPGSISRKIILRNRFKTFSKFSNNSFYK